MSLIKKNRKTVIGILGGGQLARMSAFQAIRMGFEVAILEKEKDSPAGSLTKNEFVGWVDNEEIFNQFIEASDVITLENEFIDSGYLSEIEKKGKKVIPSSKTISLIQDKFIQKTTIQKAGVPVPQFINVSSDSTYENISSFLGKKFLLKSRKMGYDGYGNATIKNKNQFETAIQKLSSRHAELYAEEFISFQKELAIMVVRTKKEIKTYPVVETIQKNHICHLVIAPAQIEKRLMKQAKEIAIHSVEAVNGYGIFGIEMFLDNGNKILVNEMAPRPHNSGHYTIEGCITSQFENHIRAVLNLPLGSTEMIKPFAVMINLLGKRNDIGVLQNYESILQNERVKLHVYGKKNSRVGRKMGHITVVGDNLNSLIKIAKSSEKKVIL
ncbi:MAG: 5-(carboxyamino)imidazole ribonucleotide synthase [Ignavibacterium sp.]|nr:5-(carboxyamino)imidazole ribonucleotide synthase [Ignavibacterium sp.]